MGKSGLDRTPALSEMAIHNAPNSRGNFQCRSRMARVKAFLFGASNRGDTPADTQERKHDT